MERVEGKRRIVIDADLLEAEKPLFEVVTRTPVLNDGGQPVNMRENGRSLMSLGLDGVSLNGNRLGRYLSYDPDRVTDITVIEVTSEAQRDQQRQLYRLTRLEADVDDPGVLVFYNMQE